GLQGEELQANACCYSTAPALRLFLVQRPEVREVSEAVRAGKLSADAVRTFVAALLKDLQRGVHFQHDVTLAALAVVAEEWRSPFADEFLRELAALNLAEMPLGPRVAREALRQRSSLLTHEPRAGPRTPVAPATEPAQPTN